MGALCRFTPTNNAFMDCGHGIGHGLYLYLNMSQVPTQVPSLEVLERQYEGLVEGEAVLPSESGGVGDLGVVGKMMFGAESAAMSMSGSEGSNTILVF